MEPQLSGDELKALEHYLHQPNQSQLQEQLKIKYATYSEEELQVIFPAFQKLLYDKARKNKRLNSPDWRLNYGYLSLAGADKPEQVFSLVSTHRVLLTELLADYRQEADRLAQANSVLSEPQRRNQDLFNLNIAQMTQEQYAQFKRLIGE